MTNVKMPSPQQRLHNVENLGLLDARAVQLVEALPVVAAAEVHVVRAKGLADKGHLGEPGPRAAVGAARHAHDDGVLAETRVGEAVFELGDEHRQVALRLGHGEAAGGESDAGRRAEAEAGKVHIVEGVLFHEQLDGGEVVVVHVAEDEVLVAGEAKLALVHLGNGAEARLHLERGRVLDAAVFDEKGKVVQARLVLDPAKRVDVGLKLKRPGGLELCPPEILHLAAEDVDAHVVNGVLETRVLAVLAVAVVALHEHNLFAGNVHVGGRDVAKHAARLRIRLLVVVRGAHAAAGQHVEALEVAVCALDGNQPNVVRVDVGVVVRRDGNGDFKLAREIGRSVQGLKVLDRLAGDLRLLLLVVAVVFRQPNLVVGVCRRQQVVADFLGARVDLAMVLGLRRQRAAHDVAVDVAAGGNRRHERAVDGLHGGLELALDDAVKLKRLTRRQLHRLVAELVGNVVHLDPLPRGRHAARQAASDHEGVSGLETLRFALVAHVAVVLHVGAVKLGELLVSGRDGGGGRVREALEDGAAEEVGSQLDVLVGDGRGLVREAGDVVDAEGLPDLGLPLGVARLVAVGILVVAEADISETLAAEVGQDAVQVLGRLVVVDLVFLAGPVVAVAKAEEGVIDSGQVKIGVVLDGLPESETVLRKLALSSRRGEKDNVLLGSEVLEGVVLHGKNRRLQTSSAASVTKPLGQGGRVAVVRGVENGERGSQQTLKQLVVCVLGLALLLRAHLGTIVLGQTGRELRLLVHELGKLVVAREKRLELLLDQLRVERKIGLALCLVIGVPSVQGPVAGVDGLFGLLQNGEGRVRLAKVG
ncbi:hypothetical protein HC256_009173 [Beauveria bassiana]|nr:hypothetical protein HC256_009173 [Beauveria bassiana]